MTTDLVVRDVLAALPDRTAQVDIEVTDGRITGVVPAGSAGRGRREIAGEGREAFPGAIDPHAHFRWSEDLGVEGDGFQDLCDAAVGGGMTSFIAHVIAPPDVMGLGAIRPLLDHSGKVAPDFGFHYVMYPNPAQLDHLPDLFEAGVRSIKMFFAYPERGFMFEGPLAIETFHRIQALGGIALIHAEEGNTIRWVEDRGRRELGASASMQDYYASRPERLEVVSIDQVALWASLSGCPLYIVHLSTAPGLALLRDLKKSGNDITVETCPQYLTLDPESTADLGALMKFAPVLRPKEHQTALWGGVVDGVIETIGSDHAGHTKDVKLERAGNEGIFGTPFGIPGIETLFPLVYTRGFVENKITRNQLADLTSTNTARRFGWFPKKGAIQEGSDADLLIVDPDDERAVSAEHMRSRASYSPYEGMLLRGWPSMTIRRGEVVFDGRSVISGGGGFIPTQPVSDDRRRT